MQIDTPRLRLLACTPAHCEAILAGRAAMERLLKVTIPEKWTLFGTGPIKYAYGQLLEDPASAGWWTYLVIHREDERLIGTCGYKGRPDEDGLVEIGYEVAEGYRRQGLANEIAHALLERAFGEASVTAVIAHTLAEENASAHLLKSLGMEFVEEISDPDDGDIWQWRLSRNGWAGAS